MKALLGVQSHFSFHWGTASPAAWFARAERLGYSFLGIADHASLCSLPETVKHAAASPVRPLYGATFPLANGQSLAAFAENGEGYGNLCQLVTDWRSFSARRPEARAGGVPALSEDAALLALGPEKRFGGLVFLANSITLWHALRKSGAEIHWRIGPALTAPPAEIGPSDCVFAPGPFMLARGDYETHRLLRAIGGGAAMDRAARTFLAGDPDNWLRPPGEYAAAFAVYAESIDRADALAERLSRFAPRRDILHPPAPGEQAAEETPLAQLRRLAYEGAAIRYGRVDAKAQARLEHELDLIDRKSVV